MSVDRFGVRKKLLGQVLKEMKLVHEGQIQEGLQIQKKEGGPIGQILVKRGYITEPQLMLALGRQSGLEVVDLREMGIQKDAVEKVDESIARPFQFDLTKHIRAGENTTGIALDARTASMSRTSGENTCSSTHSSTC